MICCQFFFFFFFEPAIKNYFSYVSVQWSCRKHNNSRKTKFHYGNCGPLSHMFVLRSTQCTRFFVFTRTCYTNCHQGSLVISELSNSCVTLTVLISLSLTALTLRKDAKNYSQLGNLEKNL